VREIRRELKSGFVEIRAEIAQLRGEAKKSSGDLKGEIKELRGDLKSMQRTMLYGFFSLGGFLLVLAGFQIS